MHLTPGKVVSWYKQGSGDQGDMLLFSKLDAWPLLIIIFNVSVTALLGAS
jgi:hypothetical protein